MINTQSILLSSEVSKDGTQFPIKALEDALALSAIIGAPACLGHDSTLPVGWNTPFALYFEPGLCRLAGTGIIAEDEDDQRTIFEAFNRRLQHRYFEDCEPYIERFDTTLKKYLSGNQRLLSSTFVCCIDVGVVRRVYPKLFEKVDKNGLVYLKNLLNTFDYLGQGVFKDKQSEFAICAHQYFRKSLSVHNNLNYFFLDHLMSLSNLEEIELRLRIDEDRIGFADSIHSAMEFEYWHGPKFSNDIPTIKNEVTVHAADEYHRLFYGIERTEFYRKLESGEQTFEIEEVKGSPSLGISTRDFGCRYIHSQFDVSTRNFKHFDGAIRMYSQEKMELRSQRNIKNAGKDSVYTKLFRIDGQLPLEHWQGLIYNYFQGNNLIEEYFTGESCPIPLLEVDERANQESSSILPIAFSPEDGLRIAISYISAEGISFEEHSHFLLGFDEIDNTRKVVEADIIEVRKHLARNGYVLQIPTQIEFVDCDETRIWNIPSILIRNDSNIEDYISATLKSIFAILSSDSFNKNTVSFTLKWKRGDDVLIGVSVVGHKATICNWINANPTIPLEKEAFRDWLESQHELLANFSKKIDKPKVFSMLNSDGVLYLKREALLKYVEPGTLIGSQSGEYRFRVKKEFENLFEGLETQIGIAPVIVIKRSTCSKCGDDYEVCPHSRITDNVTQTMVKYEIVGYCLV